MEKKIMASAPTEQTRTRWDTIHEQAEEVSRLVNNALQQNGPMQFLEAKQLDSYRHERVIDIIEYTYDHLSLEDTNNNKMLYELLYTSIINHLPILQIRENEGEERYRIKVNPVLNYDSCTFKDLLSRRLSELPPSKSSLKVLSLMIKSYTEFSKILTKWGRTAGDDELAPSVYTFFDEQYNEALIISTLSISNQPASEKYVTLKPTPSLTASESSVLDPKRLGLKNNEINRFKESEASRIGIALMCINDEFNRLSTGEMLIISRTRFESLAKGYITGLLNERSNTPQHYKKLCILELVNKLSEQATDQAIGSTVLMDRVQDIFNKIPNQATEDISRQTVQLMYDMCYKPAYLKLHL